MSPSSRIDLLLSAARARLDRLTPEQARCATGDGAVVVDIRPAGQRAEHGDLPGALVVERNVLEWRFDPTCESALGIADDDLWVVVLCQEGYTSSLAAAALLDVGVRRATDVIGGYAAWVGSGVAAPATHRHLLGAAAGDPHSTSMARTAARRSPPWSAATARRIRW